MRAMLPLLLPVYCSPSEAFALSEISSPVDFRDELHRMLLEGLPSTGIRYIRRSWRVPVRKGIHEDIPLKDWLDHVPTLTGEVLTRKSFPRVVTYRSIPSFCHLDFSDNAEGMASYRAGAEQPRCGSDFCGADELLRFHSPQAAEELSRHRDVQVSQPRLVWYDLRFLTKDFLERQKRPSRTGKPLRRASTRQENLAASKLIKEAGVPMSMERAVKIALASFPHMRREDARKIARETIGNVRVGRPKK
jgi:hypothetical protein